MAFGYPHPWKCPEHEGLRTGERVWRRDCDSSRSAKSKEESLSMMTRHGFTILSMSSYLVSSHFSFLERDGLITSNPVQVARSQTESSQCRRKSEGTKNVIIASIPRDQKSLCNACQSVPQCYGQTPRYDHNLVDS